MTPNTLEMLVRLVLSDATGASPATIRKAHSLEDRYGFSQQGLQTLAFSLNGRFAGNETPITPPLAPQETQACETVRDLMNLIKTRFGV